MVAVDLREAAKITGMDPRTLSKKCRKGHYPSAYTVPVGKQLEWRIPLEELGVKDASFKTVEQAWIDRMRNGTHTTKRPLSPNTIESHQQGLMNYWKISTRTPAISNINPAGFELVMGEISQNGACHYAKKRQIYDALCSLYRYLIKEGFKSKEELEELQELRPKRFDPVEREVVYPDEIKGILDAARMPWLKLIIGLMFYTGLRRSEACYLKLQMVDLEHQSLSVLGKGRKLCTLGLPQELKVLTENYLKTRPKVNSQYLLCTSSGTPFMPSNVNTRFASLGKRLGRRIHPHALRRGCQFYWTAKGLSPYEVKEIMRHNSVEMGDIYYQPRMLEIMEKMRGSSKMEPTDEELALKLLN